MSWDEFRARWEADPEWQAAYVAEYPYGDWATALAEHRAGLNLTQRQFARRMGFRLRDVREWESGKHPVPLSAFGIPKSRITR